MVIGGMGDIMFAKHLGNYVTRWCSEAGMDVKLSYAFNTCFDPNADTVEKRIQNSGIDPKQVVKLKYVDKNVMKYGVTDGVTVYGTTKSIRGFDLFLLAPTTTVFFRLPEYALYGLKRVTTRPPGPSSIERCNPRHHHSDEMYVSKKGLIVNDLARSFPGASSSNTVLFSVYNPEDDADENDDFDFPMGVGEGKFGIFIPPAPKISQLPHELEGKRFVLIYVSPNSPKACIENFLHSVRETYAHALPVSIVLPNHTYEKLGSPSIPGLEFLPNLLPLTAPQFAAVVKNSLPHIMMTGNQSVSDVIACCTDKTFWYQPETWTAEFGTALNKYGGAVTCAVDDEESDTAESEPQGSLLDIKTHWNFEQRAKPKLMTILTKNYLLSKIDAAFTQEEMKAVFNQLPDESRSRLSLNGGKWAWWLRARS